MYGLADGNNFYASCERAFRPELNGVPIVVLSNNDGCVIARSNEVKALGIRMGVPAFQIKREIEEHNIQVFSSNYTLYGDMSTRMMATFGAFTPEMEIYSIDEAFLDLSGMQKYFNLKEYGEQISRTVKKNIGIPVSLGVAPTKTLAKVANKFAKRHPSYKGCCLIDSEEKRIKALKLTDVSDIWGIGKEYAKKLRKYKVNTAYDFTQMPYKWIRKQFTVVGERIWRELRGESCLELELIEPKKDEICTSRSFGGTLTDLNHIAEAVATYATICGEKLRKQQSYAASLMVFIHTNNFNKKIPQYSQNCVIELPVPTNNTPEIVKYAMKALRNIFKKGYQYKKAGVILTELVHEDFIQSNMFVEPVIDERQIKLMQVMDKFNNGFNKNLITLATQGVDRTWKLKQDHLSPCYSTRLSDALIINCK